MIFEALESILIRLADDLSKYLIVGENIVKKVWGAYTGSIFTSLMSRNKASHIKTTLKLLTAMTMLGETSAKAILTQIDFSNQNIQMLFSRRDRKVIYNRMLFSRRDRKVIYNRMLFSRRDRKVI